MRRIIQASGWIWVVHARSLQWTLVGAVVVSLSGLVSCGPSGSDTKLGGNSRTAVSRAETAGKQAADQVVDRGVNLGGEQSGLKDRLVQEQPAIGTEKMEWASTAPGHSNSGTTSYDRPVVDSRTETLNSQLSLTPAPDITEEGEIPPMQATPAMALEQYWALQQQPTKK